MGVGCKFFLIQAVYRLTWVCTFPIATNRNLAHFSTERVVLGGAAQLESDALPHKFYMRTKKKGKKTHLQASVIR